MFSAGRPPLGQMPFLVTPEGKVLAQSGAIMKYIWKKAGIKTNIGSGALSKGPERAGCIQCSIFLFVPA